MNIIPSNFKYYLLLFGIKKKTINIDNQFFFFVLFKLFFKISLEHFKCNLKRMT